MFQNKNLSAVRNNALFRGINDANLNFNFNPKDFKEVGEGEIIYQSGDTSDCLYLVIEGAIKLKITGGISSPFILRKTNNDFFGEKEIQENISRKSSAVADKNSLLYLIRKAELNLMAQKNKDLRHNLLGETIEDIETDSNKKETVFDGLLENLSEQSFFKYENNETVEKTSNIKSQVIEESKPDIKNEKEIIVESELSKAPGIINNQAALNNLNDQGMNVNSLENNGNSSDTPPEARNRGTSQEHSNLPINELIGALYKVFSNLNPEDIYISIPEAISTILSVENIFLYLMNIEINEFRTKIKTELGYSDFLIKSPGNLFLKSVSEDKPINLTKPVEGQVAPINPTPSVPVKSMLIFPIKDEKGNIVGVLQLVNSKKEGFDSGDERLITTISPLMALAINNSLYKQDILQSDRLKSLNKVANFLINDIKNPIVLIKQYSEHIKRQEESKEIKLVLDRIIEQANCVVDLVQTTLGYSEGKSRYNPQSIYITDALNYILSMLAEYVESRNVKLFKKFDGNGLVNLDQKEFYQACFQIAKNACDAMPQGGNFYVVTKREHDKISIEFRDNGLGIPASIKDIIFEPFMTQYKEHNSGLGLAIVENIIKEHKGNIRVESIPGEGANFIIDLPVSD
jgi:chemotaxis protein histidine kinase CheA